MNDSIVCLIPSGGKGHRMKPYKGLKEMLTIGYKDCEYDKQLVRLPKILFEYVLENMLTTGATKVIVVINESKNELVKFLGNGSQYKANIAFINQSCDSKYYGMPIAIDLAYPWIKNSTVLMGMPDTIVEPDNSFSTLLSYYRKMEADLVLGVYPTRTPYKLAPVEFDENNKVIKIYDKPQNTNIFNTWNTVVWGCRFTDLIHNEVSKHLASDSLKSDEIVISDIFNLAISNGLKVYSLFFEKGCCYDMGNIKEYQKITSSISLGRVES